MTVLGAVALVGIVISLLPQNPSLPNSCPHGWRFHACGRGASRPRIASGRAHLSDVDMSVSARHSTYVEVWPSSALVAVPDPPIPRWQVVHMMRRDDSEEHLRVGDKRQP